MLLYRREFTHFSWSKNGQPNSELRNFGVLAGGELNSETGAGGLPRSSVGAIDGFTTGGAYWGDPPAPVSEFTRPPTNSNRVRGASGASSARSSELESFPGGGSVGSKCKTP